MKLKLESLENKAAWEKSGIRLPQYDVKAVREKTINEPQWIHFGIGNIFRIFIGGISEKLLNEGIVDKGIICAEAYDFDILDKIYEKYDNLGVNVILKSDGTRDISVMGALCEAVKADPDDAEQYKELARIFSAPSLQMVSCTITEKGYALKNADGIYFEFIEKDIEAGPGKCKSAMAIITDMLFRRYKAGKYPLALVSMDNCSRNGENFRNSVLQMAAEWQKRGFVDEGFVNYVSDEKLVTFPWTMIDKITARPAENIQKDLEDAGVEDMAPIITSKKTFIAPFANAEGPQYLVIEDSFPNGRPQLEKAGVYMTDRETVNNAERMKVSACLNPIHSGLATYGVVLGYEEFAKQMKDPAFIKYSHMLGEEGMKVVPDPGIISPRAFLNECLDDRFTNIYLGDTTQRLCTDISMGLGVRFGVTVRSYVEKFGSAKDLVAVPYAIAGWLRYLLQIDDQGNKHELAPDPMNEEIANTLLKDIKIGDPDSLKDQLKPILSNKNIFFVDLYEAGIGEKIEEIFRQLISKKGAVREFVDSI